MSKMGQRIALSGAPLRRHLFVAAGERNRLERQERDNLRIVEREADYRPNLLVVDAVDDGDDRYDLDARVVQVVYCLKLNVKKITDQPMRIGFVSDSVELEIC